MALEGSLSDFGLADIMQLIYFQKKTGVLALSGEPDNVSISFHDGNIVSVESGKKREEGRVARVLAKEGLIIDQDLISVLEEQKKTSAGIPDIILKRGLAKKEEIIKVLAAMISEMVAQLFSWKEGTYEFEQQPVVPDRDMPLELDTQHVMMDGLRIMDEWALIEGRVTLDTVFVKKSGTEGSLTDDERLILSFVDGEKDAGMIIEMSGMDDFQASKALVSLMDKGIIEAVAAAPLVVGEIIDPSKLRDKRDAYLRFLPAIAFITAFTLSLIVSPLLDRSRGKVLEAVRDIERLRSFAEGYKQINGVYPEGLNQNNKTDPWGRLYVYKADEDGVIIFSAGPDGKKETADDIF